MGLKGTPRGRYERLDVLLAARIWKKPDHSDPTLAATCRNISARGCRFTLEESRPITGFNLDSPIYFSFELPPAAVEISGGGTVVWFKREHGEKGKTRMVLGVQFKSIGFSSQERIKAFISNTIQRAGKSRPS